MTRSMIVAFTLLASCSTKEAPPMAGACANRVVANLFNEREEAVPFRECRWQGRVWVCRLIDDWQCVAVAQAN
jgi:hypothetical protein